MTAVGSSIARRDALGKTTGETLYTGDVPAPDALVAKVVFTSQPHARLLSLDVAKAEAAPGVVCVITAADVRCNEYGLTVSDQPVLIGAAGTPAGRAVNPGQVDPSISRWEADHLAVIVAETAAQATSAAALIAAEWEPLAIVADIDAALAADAPLVHPELNPAVNNPGANDYHRYLIDSSGFTPDGDPGALEAAFQAAAVVVEATYTLPHQEHAFLQTEAATGYVEPDGTLTLETSGQWTHEDQEQIANALAIDLDENPTAIRVIYRAIGGAFGGKEDMSLQIVIALAAQKVAAAGIDRPVRCEWSREESIVGHHKRHRGKVNTRWAADANGKLLAIEADGYLDAGAYNYTSNKVLGNLHISVAGPYEVPHARIRSSAVYTNTVPGGAFRGFGAPQACFVAESQMNRLAEALGIDPVEIRRRNLLHDGSTGITGTPMPPGVSIPAVVEACAEAARWEEPKQQAAAMSPFASLPASNETVRRGRGFACAFKNVGFSFGFPERSEARIVMHAADGDPDAPGWAELFIAGAEVGQGHHTVALQLAADAIGLSPEHVQGRFSDTATAGDSGSASASRLTFMAGNAILGAAEEAEKAWRDGARPAEGMFRYTPPPTEPLDPASAPTVPNFAYGYVAEAVDLSVDTATGHIVVHDVVCAVDLGRVLNPRLAEGQVEGGVVQAHGYALSENLQVAEGRILNPRFSGYLIPGVGDIPESVRSVLLEHPDPLGPLGARGMAEMPLIPYAPAIAAALHDATGVWFTEFPLTPWRVLAGLQAAQMSR